ncbi:MAG: inositol monophosphatase family protein [Desulfosarcinaceae bacterium]|jgi:myo-inositol-1(or 4)-monophosphatase
MQTPTGSLDIGNLSLFAEETIKKMGQEALKFCGKGSAHPPFDRELVTQAELHLINAFQDEINARYPEHLVFGQDVPDEGYTHDAKRYLWIFDPLDGVDNFQSGIPIWGMSLALYENYWPLLGLFLMPATKDLFRAVAGKEAYWNDRLIHMSDRESISQESVLLTFSRFHQYYLCSFPGKMRDFGSTGAHFCYVAMGRADAAVIANETFKDLAAVSVILSSAGGRLLKDGRDEFYVSDYMDGRRLDEHLLIASDANARLVNDCLKRTL